MLGEFDLEFVKAGHSRRGSVITKLEPSIECRRDAEECLTECSAEKFVSDCVSDLDFSKATHSRRGPMATKLEPSFECRSDAEECPTDYLAEEYISDCVSDLEIAECLSECLSDTEVRHANNESGICIYSEWVYMIVPSDCMYITP